MEVREYVTPDGKAIFSIWLRSLRDREGRRRIRQRIIRLRLGNAGNTKSVSHGVHELRIYYGPGYRVYYGQLGKDIMLLLCGGDKRTQKDDIKRALAYWRDYRRRIWNPVGHT